MDIPFSSRVRLWISSALLFLFFTSVIGLLMRYKVLTGVPPLPYLNILHAHSHTALLGFGFLFIMGAYRFILLSQATVKPIYYRCWMVYIVGVLGMLISFLYQSYGPISITFSTIVMLTAYVFIFYFLRDFRKVPPEKKNPLISWSIYWFLISTLGIWVLGPVSVTLGKSSDLYFLSIQFFLHFQFNGWFMFAIAGLLVHYTKFKGSIFKIPAIALWLMNVSLVLTYFLGVTYIDGSSVYFILTSTGVILQIVAWYLILKPVVIFIIKEADFSKWTTELLWTGISCLILKVLLQGLVVFPSLAIVSYSVREFIVGYIHLILLGGMTLTGGAILLRLGIIMDKRWSRTGWIGLAVTFIIMEIILFGHAILTWQGMGNASIFIRVIFYVTIPFPVFTGCMVWGACNVTKAPYLL